MSDSLYKRTLEANNNPREQLRAKRQSFNADFLPATYDDVQDRDDVGTLAELGELADLYDPQTSLVLAGQESAELARTREYQLGDIAPIAPITLDSSPTMPNWLWGVLLIAGAALLLRGQNE